MGHFAEMLAELDRNERFYDGPVPRRPRPRCHRRPERIWRDLVAAVRKMRAAGLGARLGIGGSYIGHCAGVEMLAREAAQRLLAEYKAAKASRAAYLANGGTK